jgi:hypothetical protein
MNAWAAIVSRSIVGLLPHPIAQVADQVGPIHDAEQATVTVGVGNLPVF